MCILDVSTFIVNMYAKFNIKCMYVLIHKPQHTNIEAHHNSWVRVFKIYRRVVAKGVT
jgi:hypothetical protein